MTLYELLQRKEIFMGMYHKNHLVGPGFKRHAERQRKAVEKILRIESL